MIELDKWYRFIDKNDKRLFLEYAKSNLHAEYDDEIDYMEKDVLKITYQREIDDELYTINYRTYYDPHYINAKTFTNKDAEDILKRLKGNINMVGCYKETATVRSIMEREYNKEMRELEEKRDKLIDEEYLMTEIGKQAKILADLIMANTCLKPDFKLWLTNDIMPLSIQRGIAHIKDNFSKDADELAKKYQNLEAMLSICDTYEQKEKLLKKYHIVK